MQDLTIQDLILADQVSPLSLKKTDQMSENVRVVCRFSISTSVCSYGMSQDMCTLLEGVQKSQGPIVAASRSLHRLQRRLTLMKLQYRHFGKCLERLTSPGTWLLFPASACRKWGWKTLVSASRTCRKLYITCESAIVSMKVTKARFPLPELTARVNGPSWRVTGFHYPSTLAVLTGARFH